MTSQPKDSSTSIRVAMLTTNHLTGTIDATLEVAGHTIPVADVNIIDSMTGEQRKNAAIDKGLEDNPDLVLTRADSDFWKKIKDKT